MKKNLTNIEVILFIGTIIKLLGLIYKILLTRIISIEGMRIMSFIFPTLSLMLCLSSLSIQTVVNQNISANLNSSKTILKSAFRITFISSSLISIILLISFPLYKIIYQTSFVYYPLLICIPLIYFSNISGLFKGYLEANNNFKTPYFSNLYEQLAKFFLTFLLLIIFKNKDLNFKILITFFALMASEVVSFCYLLFKIKKHHKFNYILINTNGYEKNILKQAIPLTLDQLAITITNYLEPLFFYYAMSKNNISIYQSTLFYTKVSSYAVPLLLFAQFGIYSITKYTFPKITKNKDNNKLNIILSKALFISSVIAVFNLVISLFYARETLLIMYKDDTSFKIVNKLSFFYLFSYFNPIFISILQAYKQEKKLFIISIINSLITLILIFTLTCFFQTNGFLSSIKITNILKFTLLLYFSNKCVNFKINIKNTIYLIIVFIIYLLMNYLYKSLITLIISTLACGILVLLLYYFFYNKNKQYDYLMMHK